MDCRCISWGLSIVGLVVFYILTSYNLSFRLLQTEASVIGDEGYTSLWRQGTRISVCDSIRDYTGKEGN